MLCGGLAKDVHEREKTCFLVRGSGILGEILVENCERRADQIRNAGLKNEMGVTGAQPASAFPPLKRWAERGRAYGAWSGGGSFAAILLLGDAAHATASRRR